MTSSIDAPMNLLGRVIDAVVPLLPNGTDEFTIEIAYTGEPQQFRGSVRLLDEMRDRIPVAVPDHVHAIVADSATLFSKMLDPRARKAIDGLPAIHASVSFRRGKWSCGSFGTPHEPMSDAPRKVGRIPERTPWVARFIDGDPNPQSLPRAPQGMDHSAYFGKLLSAKRWDSPDGWMEIARTRAGLLNVRSGSVVIWDAMCFPPFQWAVVEMPPGEHSVWFIQAKAADMDIAAAVVVACGKRKPVRWAAMEPPGFDPKGEGGSGVGVDAATMGFMDLDGLVAFTRDYERGERAFHRHDRAIERLRLSGERVATYAPDPNSGLSVVMTDTGSDGFFPVLAGFDEQGALACVAVDFMSLFEESDNEGEEDDAR